MSVITVLGEDTGIFVFVFGNPAVEKAFLSKMPKAKRKNLVNQQL